MTRYRGILGLPATSKLTVDRNNLHLSLKPAHTQQRELIHGLCGKLDTSTGDHIECMRLRVARLASPGADPFCLLHLE